MTTPPPAVRAAEKLGFDKLTPYMSQETIDTLKERAAQIITSEYAPMVEALEKAIGLCHVPECNQDDEWATELSKCEQTLELLKGKS